MRPAPATVLDVWMKILQTEALPYLEIADKRNACVEATIKLDRNGHIYLSKISAIRDQT